MARSVGGDTFTAIVLDIFRLNGALVATGDRLVGDLGLSTARWQVLGMVVDAPMTVSAIARRMGLTRQSVQRTADRLVRDGYARTRVNPQHRSAKLYELSPHGRQVMAAVNGRQEAWADRLADGLRTDRLEGAGTLLKTLLERLETDLETKEVWP